MRKLIVATVLGATAVGGGAFASQNQTSPKTAAAESITRAQFLDHASQKFERLDTNNDGVLTKAERKGGIRDHHRGVMGHRGFLKAPQDQATPGTGERRGRGMGGAFADTDGDGKISRAEFTAQQGKMFERLDANRSGILEANELSGGPRGGRMAQRLDQDGDGKVTRAEFDKQATARFERMDANGDGQIDASERPQRGPGRRGAAPQPAPGA